ncbi:TonB family protein [Pontibacter toksunensis]|uniref:TonB family protein n=1 Tax=Pontibacter toksunensis TaxID=1332631 RepID=A0ABW6BYI4_9BACT
MKQTLLLPLVLLLALASAHAQQEVTIYYNQEWEVTKKENATYTRLATVPDSLIPAGQLFTMPFDKTVTDYYSSGQVLGKGSYMNGQKQGNWLFYYPNGQLQGQGSYKNNEQVGRWKLWRDNGQPLQEVVHNGVEISFQNYWDETGTQTVIDGTGTYVALLPGEEPGTQMQLKGAYINGVRHGKWQYASLANGKSGKPVIEQLYKNGAMVRGYIQQQGKAGARIPYTSEDRFNLVVDFPYLAVVERWAKDADAFKPNFPVLAYMLKFDVQEVYEKNEAQQQVKSYQVVYSTATGSDTLKLAQELIPDNKPVFLGGEQDMLMFLVRNIRYPVTAQRAGVQGMVVVSFTVMPDGSIGDIKMLKSLGYGLDEEAIRVVKLMPKWQPAISNNAPVAASYALPVRFTIQSPPPQQMRTTVRHGY